MFSFSRNICKFISNRFGSCSFILLSKNSLIAPSEFGHLTKFSIFTRPCLVINSFNFEMMNLDYRVKNLRYFSKKKGSKRTVEIEEESDSDSDEEQSEESIADDEIVGDNVIQKNVSSIRLDSILKAGLGLTKKKIEQEFYAFKLRVNGKPAVKKGMNVYAGDELDLVKGYSPETNKFLTVHRVTIKGIGKATPAGMFPVKLEVLKNLTIENYEDAWNPSSYGQLEK